MDFDRVKKCKKLCQLQGLIPDAEWEMLSGELSKAEAYRERILEVFPPETCDGPAPEEELWMIGRIGMAGSRFLLEAKSAELEEYFPGFFLREMKELLTEDFSLPDPDFLKKCGASYLYSVAEGGLFRTIYDMGKSSGLGFAVFYEEVPVLQETIELCEYFDLDPWELFGGDCLIAAVSRGGAFYDALSEKGYHAVRIGRLTKQISKEVRHKEIASGINRPKPDALVQMLTKALD